MNKEKCPHGYELDANGEHIIPSGVAMSMGEAVKVYQRHDGQSPIFVHGPATEQKKERELSTAELMAEAQKIIDRKEPVSVTVTPKPKKPINQIKKFHDILKDAANY